MLDHMLMGLWITPHEGGAGENSLFKWSGSANKLVIRCSIFKVDTLSLNHAKAMAVPGRIDDSACPEQPTTIVWLGGGPYPGDLPNGVRVTSQLGVWTRAVHGLEVRTRLPDHRMLIPPRAFTRDAGPGRPARSSG